MDVQFGGLDRQSGAVVAAGSVSAARRAVLTVLRMLVVGFGSSTSVRMAARGDVRVSIASIPVARSGSCSARPNSAGRWAILPAVAFQSGKCFARSSAPSWSPKRRSLHVRPSRAVNTGVLCQRFQEGDEVRGGGVLVAGRELVARGLEELFDFELLGGGEDRVLDPKVGLADLAVIQLGVLDRLPLNPRAEVAAHHEGRDAGVGGVLGPAEAYGAEVEDHVRPLVVGVDVADDGGGDGMLVGIARVMHRGERGGVALLRLIPHGRPVGGIRSMELGWRRASTSWAASFPASLRVISALSCPLERRIRRRCSAGAARHGFAPSRRWRSAS
jgi:hypothetical protein